MCLCINQNFFQPNSFLSLGKVQGVIHHGIPICIRMQKDARSTPEATISNKVANERRRRGKSNLGDSMEEGKELETRVEEKPSQNKIVNE